MGLQFQTICMYTPVSVRQRRIELAMEFFEAPAFSSHLAQYFDDAQYRALQNALTRVSELGDVMPGTGGFRKLRWADARRGNGRRGGLRIIYYWFDGQNQIWLMISVTRARPAI